MKLNRALSTTVILRSRKGATSLQTEFAQRWAPLLDALMKPKRYAVWANPFVHTSDLNVRALFLDRGLKPLSGVANRAHLWAPCSELDNMSRPSTFLPKPPTCSRTGLKLYYPLDLASAMPVLALLSAVKHLHGGVRLLDSCSAPGGKFLIMAGAFFDSDRDVVGCLVGLERDKFRFNRLRQNLKLYLPPRVLQKVHVALGDATHLASSKSPLRQLGIKDSEFDAVLVDAPCSSERERLLRGGPEIQRAFASAATGASSVVEAQAAALAAALCEPFKVQSNVRRQVDLLSAGLRCAPHGHVVYSTCALSALENQGVVAQCLTKARAGADSVGWHCIGDDLDIGLDIAPERREYGWQILPDRSGWGPMYWAPLRGPLAASST